MTTIADETTLVRRRRRWEVLPYWLILPTVAYLGVFFVWPMIQGFGLALRDEKSLDAFAAEHQVSREDAERAFRDAIERAIADAEAAKALPRFIASLISRTVESLPPWLILQTLERVQGFLPG